MVRTILFVVICCFFNNIGRTQYITPKKIIGFTIISIAGAIDGAHEAYTIDRTIFEKKYNASSYGYFGSLSWKKLYHNDRQSDGVKSKLLAFTGVPDFYHHSDKIRKIGYISGGMIVTINGGHKKPKWQYLCDFGISFGVSALTKSITFNYLR